jgi:HD-GYP domain-containing protein (c-di-GMP phosphodiesterase class II)
MLAPPTAPQCIRLSEIVSALSYALDLTEGQPMGHAVKSCVLGMRLADQLQLSDADKSQLYYAILLKDAGCSSNAARIYQIFDSDDRDTKRNLKTTDWTRPLEGFRYVRDNAAIGKSLYERVCRIVKIAANNHEDVPEIVQIRCGRGANIARQLGFSEATAAAIYHLDEHWNGRGYPDHLRGEAIPLFARILNLCQTLEVFATASGPALAFEVLRRRSGRWFDPELVRAAAALEYDEEIWRHHDADAARELVLRLEPAGDEIMADAARVTGVCEGFAAVIDAKSPWTHLHSQGVAAAAVGIARHLGLPEATITMIHQAALLHDIGKLSLPNSILDKPGRLTNEEFEAVRRHPYFTQRVLEKIASFGELSKVAGAHHERLDGSGYHCRLNGAQLSLPARILAVADVYDALSAQRPYRDALPRDRVLSIIGGDVPHALCPLSFEGLQGWLETAPSPPATGGAEWACAVIESSAHGT